MSSPSVTSAVLSVLEDQPPDQALSTQEIAEQVARRLEDRDRVPKANEIRGRLTQLRKEGVVERPERGQYALVRADPDDTQALAPLVDIVQALLRPDELRRSVLWDATPYLELAEDGGPGTRLVVEHEHASALKDEVEIAWPGEEQPFTWTVKPPGPLGLALWEPDDPAPYRIPVGIVFVEREKLGGTGLTPGGYRAPFPERVMMEFLGLEGPAEASSIVESILDDPETDFQRLWQAAENLGVVVDLSMLLAGRLDELRPDTRRRFVETVPPVVRTLMEGAR